MEKIRVSAKTKDEAITKALIQLSTTSDRLSFNVLVKGSNGLFGIGAKPWIIEASVKEEIKDAEETVKSEVSDNVTLSAKENTEKSREPEIKSTVPEEKLPERGGYTEQKEFKKRSDRRERHPSKEKLQRDTKEPRFRRGGYDPIAPSNSMEKPRREERASREIKPISAEEAEQLSLRAVEFINSVLSGMKMEVNVKSSFNHESNELMINLEGPDMGLLIGKRGQTLDSLQYLCSLVVNKEHKDDYVRVKLDTEDYRRRREQTLRTLAKNIAYKVKRSHKPVSLEPMNPYERRIIHSALQGDKFASTRSEGEEPFRHVVIFAKNNNERGHSGRPYGSRGGYRGSRHRDEQHEGSFSAQAEAGSESSAES